MEPRALDYDIHLFTDPATGHDAAVHRTGATGYTFSRIAPGPRPHPSGPPLTLDRRRAPWLTAADAIRHLNATAGPFLFFADPETRRGRILYHRYDGHYALITPVGADLRPDARHVARRQRDTESPARGPPLAPQRTAR